MGVNKEVRSIKTAKIGVRSIKTGKMWVKNGCKSTKMSEIWETMGNPMPFEKVMGPNRHNMENYGDLQPIGRSMKPTLWVPSENISSGLLPKDKRLVRACLRATNTWDNGGSDGSGVGERSRAATRSTSIT